MRLARGDFFWSVRRFSRQKPVFMGTKRVFDCHIVNPIHHSGSDLETGIIKGYVFT